MVDTMNKDDATAEPAQIALFQELVTDLHQCCQDRTRELSRRCSLPEAEIRALLLFEGERYLTPKGMTQRLKVAKSRVTRIVDGLAAKGLVARTPDPDDSRVVLLRLTPDGSALAGRIVHEARSMHCAALERIPERDRAAVLHALTCLRRSMAATD